MQVGRRGDISNDVGDVSFANLAALDFYLKDILVQISAVGYGGQMPNSGYGFVSNAGCEKLKKLHFTSQIEI